MHFQGLCLRLEAQRAGTLFQLAHNLAVFQFHGAVAAVLQIRNGTECWWLDG